jgi:hypothetical protein
MTHTVTIRDVLPITSREITPQGFLKAPARIARTGVQEYAAHSLGLDRTAGIDPMRIIRMHRPDEEVFEAASMASFEGAPVTLEHPDDDVTADNWARLAKGEVRGVTRDGDFLGAQIIIRDAKAIAAVMSGKVELSNGYQFEADMTPGETARGEKYDGIMRKIRGNHVAIVDVARCGSACRISDSENLTNGANEMNEVIKTRKVAIDGLPVQIEESAADAVETLIKQRDEARQQAADSQEKAKEAEGLKVALDAAQAKITALEKDVMTPEARDAMVRDWALMLDTAKRIAPKVTTDGKTCAEVRRAVLADVSGRDSTAKAIADAVLAGVALDKADDSTVRAAFHAVSAAIKSEPKSTDGGGSNAADVGKAAAGGTAAQDGGKPIGRAAYIERLANYGESPKQ